VTIATPQGSPYGTCVTEASAPCVVTVATGVTVQASIDPLTLPADSTAVGGTAREIEIGAGPDEWVLFVVVPSVQTPAPPAPTPTSAAVPAPVGRMVAIHEGTCDTTPPGAVVVELTDLTSPQPAAEVAGAVIVAETSSSVIDLSIEDLTATDHAVIAWSTGDIPVPVACTAIDGQVNASGELVLGIPEAGGSGYAGIVYLAPSADGAQTGVSVFLAEGLAADGATGGTPTPTPAG
jgi:hypothetical protein